MTTRIDRCMARLKAEGRPALVTYFMGDHIGGGKITDMALNSGRR